MKISTLFNKPKAQKAVTVIKVISSVEYLVADALNRRTTVQSDRSFNVGDKLIVQGSWVLGKGRVTTNIQNFEV